MDNPYWGMKASVSKSIPEKVDRITRGIEGVIDIIPTNGNKGKFISCVIEKLSRTVN